jgi:hypothetical protein
MTKDLNCGTCIANRKRDSLRKGGQNETVITPTRGKQVREDTLVFAETVTWREEEH